MTTLDTNGLSSSALTARQLHDAIVRIPQGGTLQELVLMGCSKVADEVLVAVTEHADIRASVASMVSVPGAVGGSPLVNDADDDQLNLLQHVSGGNCRQAGGSPPPDLRPETRQAWLGGHVLAAEIAYYSLATFPDPARISAIRRASYGKLARVDARNDSQLIFYDPFIPGSTLLAFLNADHWAIARDRGVMGALLVDRNDFSHDTLYEALLRFVEEDRRVNAAAEP